MICLEWGILKQNNLEEKMGKKLRLGSDMWLEMKVLKMKSWNLLIS
jgi:hypothetical protein